MQYELLFLVGHDKEANLETIEKAVEGFVAEIGGELLSARWESKRRLAYPIKHQERGVYVARRFTLPEIDMWAEDAEPQETDRITKLSRVLHLFHDILRFSIVRSEELEELEVLPMEKEQERKTHRQAIEKKDREVRAKRPATTSRPFAPRTSTAAPSAPVAASVSSEAPKKEVSVTEINDKLDEILNG